MNTYKNCINGSTKYIFVSGSIGVGKSTFINEIVKRFEGQSVAVIHEYIDYDPQGNQKLNEFLEKLIPPMEFQKYIIKCYLDQIIKNRYSNVMIFERHPMESLIFAKSSFESNIEFELLKNYISNFCNRLGIPYQNENQIMDIWHTPDTDYDTIYKNIIKGTGVITCYLRVGLDMQFYRIASRGRESDNIYLEEEDMTYLNKINSLYHALRDNDFNYDRIYQHRDK